MPEIITGPNPSFVAQQQAAQPDPIGQYTRLLQLKNLQQEQALAPLRQQAAQQQVQSGELDLRAKQRQQDSDAAIMEAYQNSGGDLSKTIADATKTGKVLPQSIAALRQANFQVQQEALKLWQAKGERAIQEGDLFDGAADAGHAAPPEQRPAVYQQQIQNLAQAGVDVSQAPQQYPGDEQFNLMRLGIKSHTKALEQAAKQTEIGKNQAQTQQAQSQTALNNMEVQRGGKTDVDKFTFDYLQSHGLENTPANRQKAFQEYTRQTKIVPAQVRVEGIGQTREMPVMDTQNGNALQYLSASDINAANKSQPGRYIPAVEGAKALSKTATIEDIRGNIQAVRENLQNPKMPEFTAQQRAQIAVALGNEHAQDALSSAFRGGVLGNLTDEQQDFLINMAQLKENAMAMRSVLGAGQGSQDLRDAITSTLPGPRNPSKAYGLNQLKKFESVLDRLEKGIPKVPLAQGGGGQQPSHNDPLGIR